jgi:hypothetical protein
MPPDPKHALNRLVVEGTDEKHAIIHLMGAHGVDWDTPDPAAPFVQDAGGLPKLLDLMALTVSTGAYARTGFVLDANENIKARWQSVRDRLKKANVELPGQPPREGAIVPGFLPESRVGVWLMPDNTAPGSLEQFLVGLIPGDDACWPHADESTRKAQHLGAGFAENDYLKARLHNWLAWQDCPGLPFGSAINARFLQPDRPSDGVFVAWFRRLFLE